MRTFPRPRRKRRNVMSTIRRSLSRLHAFFREAVLFLIDLAVVVIAVSWLTRHVYGILAQDWTSLT